MLKKNILVKSMALCFVLLSILAVMSLSAQCNDVSTDPLTQMSIAFEGNYSKQQIKERLDKAMKLYDVPRTKENYSRAGSVLVSLRKSSGCDEMEILSYMIRSYVPNTNIDFPTMAAFAATFLSVGDQ